MAENTYKIATAKGAEVFDFTYDDADLGDEFIFESGNWGWYLADGTISVGDTITPALDEAGLSAAGSVTFSIPASHLDNTYALHVRWDGSGFTMQYTMDNGDSWLPATNGMVIDLSAIAEPDVDFKATFAGGVEDDPAALTRLAVYVAATSLVRSDKGIRHLNVHGVTLSEGQGDQLAPRADEGSRIVSGAYIDVSQHPDQDNATPIKAIEFWARKDSTANGVLLEEDGINRFRINNTIINYTNPAITVQVDGVAALNAVTAVAVGTWHHYKITFATPTNNPIRIGQQANGTSPCAMTIFGLALYADDPVGTYAANMGLSALTFNDPSTITVTEEAEPLKVYAYAWSIVSG